MLMLMKVKLLPHFKQGGKNEYFKKVFWWIINLMHYSNSVVGIKSFIATTPHASRIMSNEPVPLVVPLPTRDHVAHESHQPINPLPTSFLIFLFFAYRF